MWCWSWIGQVYDIFDFDIQPSRVVMSGGVSWEESAVETIWQDINNLTTSQIITLEAPVESQEDSYTTQLIYTTSPGEDKLGGQRVMKPDIYTALDLYWTLCKTITVGLIDWLIDWLNRPPQCKFVFCRPVSSGKYCISMHNRLSGFLSLNSQHYLIV